MIGLDTNVFVRLLIADDEQQTRRAQRLVEQAEAQAGSVRISLLVVLETEWVLRSRYGLTWEQILPMFRAALATRALAFDGESALEEALHDWANGPSGFADCLIAAHHRQLGCEFTATFDAKAARLPAMRLV